MTKEQAYEKLELPVGTDLQVVRQKFNQMHNEFLMQIDGVSFNPAMKQRKEQQLEELKEAYKLLNESDSIDDSASRPYTGKTFDHGGAETRSSSAEPEPSKPKEQQVPPPPPPREETYQPREQAPPVYSAPPEKKKSNAGLFVGIAAGAIIVLAGAYFMANRSDIGNPSASETNNTEASRDSATWETVLFANDPTTYQHYIDNFPEGIFVQAAKDSIAQLQAAKADNALTLPQTEDKEINSQKEQSTVNTNWRSKYNSVWGFSEGLARVRANFKEGYVNKEGVEVIPLKYDEVYDFKDGFGIVKLNGKYGFVDKTGKEIASTKYHIEFPSTTSFNDGLLEVSINGKWGHIDKTGREVIPIKYDYASSFSEGLATVKLGDKYGFINRNDKIVIPIEYGFCGYFKEGLAAVQSGGKTGYIDKMNKVVIPFQYVSGNAFSNDQARVSLDGWNYFYINKNGECVKDCPD